MTNYKTCSNNWINCKNNKVHSFLEQNWTILCFIRSYILSCARLLPVLHLLFGAMLSFLMNVYPFLLCSHNYCTYISSMILSHFFQNNCRRFSSLNVRLLFLYSYLFFIGVDIVRSVSISNTVRGVGSDNVDESLVSPFADGILRNSEEFTSVGGFKEFMCMLHIIHNTINYNNKQIFKPCLK